MHKECISEFIGTMIIIMGDRYSTLQAKAANAMCLLFHIALCRSGPHVNLYNSL